MNVIVIGAGVVGASVAYHLAVRGCDVTVLEAAEAPATGSTGRSLAGVRAQWNDAVNIELSRHSIDVYKRFEEVVGQSAGYRPIGYLLLADEAAWPALQRAAALQRDSGVPVEVLDPEQASGLSDFSLQGLAGATWCPTDGVVDPHLVTTGFLSAARSHGARVICNAAVRTVDRHGSGWNVGSAAGRFDAAVVVNAAGGWAGDLAALAGFEVPVRHSRRMVYAGAPQPGRRSLPMTIDMASGTFLRSEGERVLFGQANPDEPEGHRLVVDWDWLETVIERSLDRFPWMAELPLDTAASWAGTYEMSPDHRPFIGWMPDADESWVNACGFSGHGIMQAPMTGLCVAEEILDGRSHTIDIDPLRIERLSAASRMHAELTY